MTPPPADAAAPLVVPPLDAGTDGGPDAATARRWLEWATFDVVGTAMYLPLIDPVRACFDRAAPERGYVMLRGESDAGTAWSVEDATGISEPTIACLKKALAESPSRYANERPHRVYVVFR